MQRHADIGHRLLRGSRSAVLECAATIAWTHHERWDGTGYPRALAGEDIPLAGRIACVADTFDALITDRVYSPAMPVHEALDVLVAERGGQFDPRVVDVFLEEVEAVHAIIARFEEEHAPAPDMVAQDAGRNGALITLREAAAGVGVSTSTLRRWADDGRIASVRTAGGHRRFPIEAVRKLAASRSAQPAVRPIAPPSDRLVALAGRLRAQGVDLAAVAAGWLYRGDGAGWFAGEAGVVAVREWLGALVRSCETGDYTPALEAGDLLMRRAYLQGATLLERHGFLERFADAAIGSLTQAGAPRADLASARRLLTVHQQRLLDSCG
jgi:excisionase family DNA binding protein